MNENSNEDIQHTIQPDPANPPQSQPSEQTVVSLNVVSSSSDLGIERDNSVPFARLFKSRNRKNALMFIIVPVLLFVLGQSGPLYIATFLMSPLLVIFIIYGVILLFKKDSDTLELKDPYSNSPAGSLPNYKRATIQLLSGLALLLVAYLLLRAVEESAGYAGSEGGIVAFPFMLSGAVLLIISLGNFIATFIKKLSSK